MALTIAVGVVAALFFWLGQGPSQKVDGVAESRAAHRGLSARTESDALALRYAKAYQSGDCDEVIGLTWWMNERLRKAALELPNDTALEAIREELRTRIQERPVEGNRLRPEGIEDGYVFAPGAAFAFVSSDKGRENLSKPVHERAWLRVTYPVPDSAPCDERGKSIRSMRVGVNVSPDGYVIKAGVVGNLDIDRKSVSCEWDGKQGE